LYRHQSNPFYKSNKKPLWGPPNLLGHESIHMPHPVPQLTTNAAIPSLPHLSSLHAQTQFPSTLSFTIYFIKGNENINYNNEKIKWPMAPLLSDRNFSYMWDVGSRQCRWLA
jgi:hypothetical protein